MDEKKMSLAGYAQISTVMARLSAWLEILVLAFGCTACNGEESATVPQNPKRILGAGLTYTENTRQTAEAIQKQTGGTLFEIEPAVQDSNDYQTVVKLGVDKMTETQQSSQIKATDSICDIVNHPAFKGFGRHILPWDDNRKNYDIPLNRIHSLLPYHTQVNSDDAVKSLNRLIDDRNDGKTIFYDIYTEREKTDDPAKNNTGLFFYRGKKGAPFAVVNPGGGFAYVGSLHEGFPYANEISEKGYNAFVLKYRTGGGQYAVEDLAAALKFIFHNAEKLGVKSDDYSLWGSSAGARMAAFFGSSEYFPKPAVIVMAYTGQSEFTQNDPPTFSVIGSEDQIASPAVAKRRAQEMKQSGIDVEFHQFRNVGHGFGLGTGTNAEGWLDSAIKFWEKHIAKGKLL